MRGDFPKTVPYGYCHCGCGEKTTISKQNHIKNGYIKGKPLKFLKGHNNGGKFGKDNPMYGISGRDAPGWKGGRRIKKQKNTTYIKILMPEHPKSDCDGCVFEHILVVEKCLGEYLSDGAVVHHMDFNGINNEPDNLIVFSSSAEHTKFHETIKRHAKRE